MKKVLTLLVCLVLCFGLVFTFAACDQTPEEIEAQLQDSEARAEYVETINDSAEKFELKASYSNVKKNSDNSTSDDETFHVYALVDAHDATKLNADLYVLQTGASEVDMSMAVLIRDNEFYMFQGAIQPSGNETVTKDNFVTYITAHIGEMQGIYGGKLEDMLEQLPPVEGGDGQTISGLLTSLGAQADENSAFATNILALFLNKVQVNGKQVTFSVDINLLIDTLFGYADDLIKVVKDNADITLSELYANEKVKSGLNTLLRNVKGAEVEELLKTAIAAAGPEMAQISAMILPANEGESAYDYIGRHLQTEIAPNTKIGDMAVADLVKMDDPTADLATMLTELSAELSGLKTEAKTALSKLLPEYNISATFEDKKLSNMNVSVKVDSSNGQKADVHDVALQMNVKSTVELMDTTKIDLAALKAAAAQ